MILFLVFVLILGGAGILYKQLGQKLAPDLLATQTPQETKSTETSTPTTQEDESEKNWHRILQFTIWMEMRYIFQTSSGNLLS